MAHIGKDYPVHFRRDTFLNLTDFSKGFGKRYTLLLGGVTGSIGDVVGNQFLDARTVGGREHELPEWSSGPITVGPDTVVVRAYVVIEGFPQVAAVYFDVDSFILGTVYTCRLSINQSSYRDRIQAGSGDVIFETPGVCAFTYDQFSSWDIVMGFAP